MNKRHENIFTANMIMRWIFTIVFVVIFLILGIVTNKWAIFIIGAGTTLIGTLLASMTFHDTKSNNDNNQGFIVQVDENTDPFEFCDKYEILEELGHNLYRVIPITEQEEV